MHETIEKRKRKDREEHKPDRHPLPAKAGGFWAGVRRVLRAVSRYSAQIIIVILALLIGLRVALPYIVKRYVNQTLDQIDGYHGHVDDVNMHLWRGAYSVKGVNVVKTGGKVPVPFFEAELIDFSVEWRALFDGSLVAKIEFYKPVINFVAGPTVATTQTGVDKPWLDVIKQLFPLDINRFEVFDGTVHYRDFYSTPKVDLKLDRIHMLALNLTNSKKLSKTLAATIETKGYAFTKSAFEVHAKIDPFPKKATFDLAAKLDATPLTEFNDYTEAYGKFHFTKGTLVLVTELAAADGKLTGYVKPLLDDMAIIDLRDVKNPIKLAWESAVAGITRLFRNQPGDRFATKIPISGTFDDPKIGILPTLGNILRNEFIRAFNGNIENSVGLKDAEKAKAPAP